jgi:peptide/nickel transport system substrate-binding protein
LSPLEIVAPTSFTIVGRYVDEMNALEDPGGNPTPLAATRAAIDFWTIVERAFWLRTFEQYFLCWGNISEESIYFVYHSNWDIPWGDNSPGIRNAQLDALLEIVEFGTDHDAKVQAHHDAQDLLSTLMPLVPVYSRNYFNAHQPESYGAVLIAGISIDNDWTWMNIKGPRESPIYNTPLTQMQGNQTIWALGEACESYNLAEAGSVYAVTVLDTIFDGMIEGDPYTLKDKPWLAKDWNIVTNVDMTTPNGATMVDGMYVEYILNDRVVAGDARWHDGEVFNADDIMFSWQYVWDNELTNFFGFWEELIDIDNPSPDKVVAYWNKTSQFLLYDGAGWAGTGWAPQVWGKIDIDGDGDNYLDDGDIEGDQVIRSYQPEDHLRSDLGSYPAQAAFPWLSQCIGQAYYVLYAASEDGYDSDLFAFDTRSHTTVVPGVHFWKSKAEIKEQKIEMFYHIGDVTVDAIVDTLDLSRMALKWLQTGTCYTVGEYLGFIQEDVTEDGKINILDLATAGKSFGKEKEY